MLGRVARTVRRQQGGQFVNGNWVPGAPVELVVEMSSQPVSGKELEFLPEARRETQSVKLYSSIKLLPQREDGTGDIVVLPYGEFEIISSEPWQSGIIYHYKSIGQKL